MALRPGIANAPYHELVDGDRPRASIAQSAGRFINRLLSVADVPADDDDLRLRKHVGVAAGLVIGIGALQLPLMAQGLPVSWAVALTMAPISLANVALLASTKRFDRYLVVLILIVTVFPAFVTVALGGMVGSSGGYIFAFVAPLFAILALGRRRATVWLLVYLAVLLVLDPAGSDHQPRHPPAAVWIAPDLLGVEPERSPADHLLPASVLGTPTP